MVEGRRRAADGTSLRFYSGINTCIQIGSGGKRQVPDYEIAPDLRPELALNKAKTLALELMKESLQDTVSKCAQRPSYCRIGRPDRARQARALRPASPAQGVKSADSVDSMAACIKCTVVSRVYIENDIHASAQRCRLEGSQPTQMAGTRPKIRIGRGEARA